MAISVCYATFTAALLYFTASVPDTKVSHPEVKIGILLFILGESINHYHHRILSDLRKDGSKEYKVREIQRSKTHSSQSTPLVHIRSPIAACSVTFGALTTYVNEQERVS